MARYPLNFSEVSTVDPLEDLIHFDPATTTASTVQSTPPPFKRVQISYENYDTKYNVYDNEPEPKDEFEGDDFSNGNRDAVTCCLLAVWCLPIKGINHLVTIPETKHLQSMNAWLNQSMLTRLFNRNKITKASIMPGMILAVGVIVVAIIAVILIVIVFCKTRFRIFENSAET